MIRQPVIDDLASGTTGAVDGPTPPASPDGRPANPIWSDQTRRPLGRGKAQSEPAIHIAGGATQASKPTASWAVKTLQPDPALRPPRLKLLRRLLAPLPP